MVASKNSRIGSVEAMAGPDKKDSLDTLERIAVSVEHIMVKHDWRVGKLVEVIHKTTALVMLFLALLVPGD